MGKLKSVPTMQDEWVVEHTYCTHNSPTRFWETHVSDTGIGWVATAHSDTEEGSKQLANLIAAAPKMHAKLDKIATWLEANAKRNEESAKTCNFESLKQAYIADAKNYRATAKDIRKLLKEAVDATS